MFRCISCGALNNVRSGASGTPVCGRCKAVLTLSGAPQDVTAEGLTRAVQSASVPVLVDFWAPWCGPCRVTSPAVDAFAREATGQVLTLKLNTDEHPAAASAYCIQGIPTFLLFLGGNVIGRRSGALNKNALASWVAQVSAAQPGAQGTAARS